MRQRTGGQSGGGSDNGTMTEGTGTAKPKSSCGQVWTVPIIQQSSSLESKVKGADEGGVRAGNKVPSQLIPLLLSEVSHECVCFKHPLV